MVDFNQSFSGLPNSPVNPGVKNLVNKGHNVVSKFDLTDENYEECLKLLEERYGGWNTIIDCHVNKIINLELVKSTNNTRALQNLHDKCEIHIRNLKLFGETSTSYENLLLPMLLKLLPENMVLEFRKKNNSKKDLEVADLLQFIKEDLRACEATLLVNNSTGKIH